MVLQKYFYKIFISAYLLDTALHLKTMTQFDITLELTFRIIYLLEMRTNAIVHLLNHSSGGTSYCSSSSSRDGSTSTRNGLRTLDLVVGLAPEKLLFLRWRVAMVLQRLVKVWHSYFHLGFRNDTLLKFLIIYIRFWLLLPIGICVIYRLSRKSWQV